MKRELYVCRCHNLEHMFVVSSDEEDFFIEIHLAPLPFWKRVRNAISYVFGNRSKWGDFDEILLSPHDAFMLGDQLIEWATLGSGATFSPNDVH